MFVCDVVCAVYAVVGVGADRCYCAGVRCGELVVAVCVCLR